MDFKTLASRLGIDEEDFMELVELFVETTRSDIEKIKKSLLECNAENAALAAHSIKGAAGNLGFEKIFELAKEMEQKARQGSLESFADDVKQLETGVNLLDNA